MDYNFEAFLRLYYEKDIMELARQYPDRRVLVVDYYDLFRHNPDAAEEIVNAPDILLKKLRDTLRGWDLPADVDLSEADVVIRNLPDKVPVHELDESYIGKLVTIPGRVNRIGDPKIRLVEGAFRCLRCEHITRVWQPENDKLTVPFECESDACGKKGPFKLIHTESVKVLQTKVELNDLYEHLKPGQPLNGIVVLVHGREMKKALPGAGTQVEISGILRMRQKEEDKGVFDMILEANYIEAKEDVMDVKLTPEDIVELKKIAANDSILDMLVRSTAPTVLGYPEIKLAVLAALVSGPNRKLPDETVLRGYIHVMVCGAPGTAKSKMAEAAKALVPRSQYAAGKQSTSKGLVVAVVPDKINGGWSAAPGAMVLADLGALFLDELDKMEKDDIQYLNTALESGKVPVHKAGVNQEFNTREPVIALSNPKNIRFDNITPRYSQINAPEDTKSRFDLIFAIDDVPDKERDTKIGEQIIRNWQFFNRNKGGSNTNAGTGPKPPIDKEILRKYISYVKTLEPDVPDNVTAAVLKYYRELRERGNAQGIISATAREMDGLIRFTRSIARLRLAAECTLADFEVTKMVYEKARETIIDPESGVPDIDVMMGINKSQRDKIKVIRRLIQGMQESSADKLAFHDDILSAAAQEGVPKDSTSEIIRKLKDMGEIIEFKEKFYRLAR